MTYPALDREAARKWWKEWAREVEESDQHGSLTMPKTPEIEWKSCGKDIEWEALTSDLVAEVTQILSDTSDYPAFEARAAEILHARLPEDMALADQDFWYWFAVNQGAELIWKRYPSTEKRPLPDIRNYVSSNGRETFFYRLWIRGQVGYDPLREDPYELVRYGDIDFWRSHIFRQMFAEVPAVLAAFVKFQYPDGPNGGRRLKGKNQEELRALVKYLRRAFANIEVELLSESEAERLIEQQWKKIEQTAEVA